MPDDRTTITELGTALGTLPFSSPAKAIKARPAEVSVPTSVWERLAELRSSGRYEAELQIAFANGKAFLNAPNALRGRPPFLVEWTGGRRPPGDEVAPVDLRIDHVYLVSCKYVSRNIANPSPARLFEGLLATSGNWAHQDWYSVVASEEYIELYAACREATGLLDLPAEPSKLDATERQQIRRALGGHAYPPSAQGAYRKLCDKVSAQSASIWNSHLADDAERERMLWRLLRVGNAPYFVLGADPKRPLRLRVASPWDWRQAFQFLDLQIHAAKAGQPRVDWEATYRERGSARRAEVKGHVEIRFSHGRFAQPPEAKVYLDTPTDQVPGYFPLQSEAGQLQLWT